MGVKQTFGGAWTIEKLDILSDYLNFYITALKNQKFGKLYIDAFAGSGVITMGKSEETIEGSARLALKATNKFDKYIFIEKKKQYAQALQETINNEFFQFTKIVSIYNEDCNDALRRLCIDINWTKNRAVLFLDPYATEVSWDTLRCVAATKAIDVWYLFPLGAINRLMKKDGNIDPSWKCAINRILGDDSWEHEFYKEDPQLNLFGGTSVYKDVNIDSLSAYICQRLSSIFPAVASTPRVLYNSKNSPLFLFCFAVANPKAERLALKVANYILNPKMGR